MNIEYRKVQNISTKNDHPIGDLPLACADEKAAVEFMEKQRWGDNPCCPHCGSLAVYQMKDSTTGERQKNFRWRCKDCNKQYSVRVGTVFEDSRAPLRHWCYAFWRASTSKKGVAALEIHRQTGLAYKSCLFMLNRIRYAMDEQDIEPLSGDVETDEVFIGGHGRHPTKNKAERQRRKEKKTPVIGMLERGGRVRPRIVADVTADSLKQAIRANVHPSARIITDSWVGYHGIGSEFAGGHHTVNHAEKEYVRGEFHTNSVEGFFGMMRRGLRGIYHNVSRAHLHRYLSEFEFRHNHRLLSDGERLVKAIKAANHKRITYRQILSAEK